MSMFRKLVGLSAAAVLLVVALGFGGPLVYELDLLGHFRMHLLGLSALVALVALAVRARRALAIAIGAGALAAAGLAPLWRGLPPGEAGLPVVVVTANVYSFNPRPAEALAALAASGADILITSETFLKTFDDAQELKSLYPHHAWRLNPGNKHDAGVAIWSKYPIRSSSGIAVPPRRSFGTDAIVEVAPGRRLSIVGLHLEHVYFGRQGEQIEKLGEVAGDLPEPLIILGDFNATAWSWAVQRVEALTGTRRVGGIIRTWSGVYPTPVVPVPEPFGLPIDHILVSEGIGVDSIGTLEIPGSDHRAVRAELRIPEGAGSSAPARAPVSSGG